MAFGFDNATFNVSKFGQTGANLSETISLSESLTSTTADAAAISDSSISLSESQTGGAADKPNLAESISLSESVGSNTTYTATLTESISLSESLAASQHISYGVSESAISLSESSASGSADSAALSETVSLSENLIAGAGDAVFLSETVGLSESLTASQTTSATVSEGAISLSEADAPQSGANPALSESISLSENLTSQQTSGGTGYSVNVGESLSLSESLAASTSTSSTVSESLSLSESLAAQLANDGELTESLSLSESLLSGDATNLTESLTLGESLTAATADVQGLTEGMGITETLGGPAIEADLAESLELSESLTATTAAAKTLTESVSLTEEQAASSEDSATLTETVGLAETILADTPTNYVDLTESLELEETTAPQTQFFLLHRLSSGTQYQSNLMHRLAVGLQAQYNLLHRISDSKYQSQLLHRLAVGTQAQESFVHRLNSLPPEIAVPITIVTSGGGGNGLGSGTPVTGMPGYVGGSPYDIAYKMGWTPEGSNSYSMVVQTPDGTYNLEDAPAYLQVTHNESGPAQWQIGIVDPTAKYHPRNQNGAWLNVMNGHKYDSSDTVLKRFVVNILYGGGEYNFVGYPTGYSDERKGPSPINFTWKGVDASDRFFRRAQTATTKRSVGTEVLTNIDLIEDACNQLQISCNTSLMRRENIRVQHRQDARWGDLVQQAVDVAQSEWQINGETLEVYQSLYTGPATWTYDKASLIKESSLTSDSPKIENQVTMRRGNEGGSNQGATAALNKFGPVTIPFHPAITNPSFKMIADSPIAQVSDCLYYNAAGGLVAYTNPSNPQNPIYAGLFQPGPIVSVTFTWGVRQVGYNAFEEYTSAPGIVQFSGAVSDPNGGSDPVYTVTMNAPQSIAGGGPDGSVGYGVQPEEKRPNPLFYDSKVMQRALRDYLTKHAFDLLPQTFRCFLNPQMRPGDRVLIEDAALGLTEVRYVKQCTHSFSDDPTNRFTRMMTVLYPLTISVFLGKYPSTQSLTV